MRTCVMPAKFAPTIFTVEPTAPPLGEKLAITGGGKSVKSESATAVSAGVVRVTDKAPEIAPIGTCTVICVGEMTFTDAPVTPPEVEPAKVTLLMLAKPVPVIVIVAPTGAIFGVKSAICITPEKTTENIPRPLTVLL